MSGQKASEQIIVDKSIYSLLHCTCVLVGQGNNDKVLFVKKPTAYWISNSLNDLYILYFLSIAYFLTVKVMLTEK